MIECAICHQKFKSIISWKHLKTHGITTTEYKEKFGDLVSDEYRKTKSEQVSGKNNPNFGNKMSDQSKKKISEANKGRSAHNKNIKMTDEQKKKLSVKAISRNMMWKETNSHPLTGRKHREETKEKIKKKRANQIITSDQVKKAIETKKMNNYDFAFFRGRKHTAEAKEKISKAARDANRKKSENSIKEASYRLSEYGFSLVSITDGFMYIECLECRTKFTRTRQYSTISKINSKICPTCHPPTKGSSYLEKQIADFLSQFTAIERNNRNKISPKEIDIYLPNQNLAIEFDGLYWHCEIFKEADYHTKKKQLAEKNGVHLIHIFEDEWVNSPEIVKSRLLSLIGKIDNKIHARKCKIKEIDAKTCNEFLNQNHIQGRGRSNVKIGLYHDNALVSVMTFLKNDISKNLSGWELNRYCSKSFTHVVGGASKIFKYFVNNYYPEKVTSFSDNRWSKEFPVYKQLGFEVEGTTPPNYWYFVPNELRRIHRYSLRKPANSQLTERELRRKEGYLRIYDCGSTKWIWKK